MNDLNFIAWLIKKAEGFELQIGEGIAPDTLVFPTGQIEVFDLDFIKLPVWKSVWLPLITIRAFDMFEFGTARSDEDRRIMLKVRYKMEKEN